MRKLTTQEFINRARTVHGDRYGYAFSVYQSAHDKVSIHCPEHGMFDQSPNQHIRGNCCPGCSGNKKHTVSSFIQKANSIHGDKYDYSKIHYVNTQTKLTIICPEHGYFDQSPGHHLDGCGCPECGSLTIKNKLVSNKHSFIEKAKLVHSDLYDYSHVEYTGNKSKVVIVCSKHGCFEQTPASHLSGYGCHDCGGTKKHTTQSFIEKSRKIHSHKYDYSKVVYKNNSERVIITCPEHGDFEQTPSSHLSGNNCPGCAKYGFDKTKVGFLYILRSECGRYMKIGITNKPEQRHSQLSRSTPFSFKLIELIEGTGDKIAKLEKELLAEYQPAEFTERFDGSTEWRLWDSKIVNQIKQEKFKHGKN